MSYLPTDEYHTGDELTPAPSTANTSASSANPPKASAPAGPPGAQAQAPAPAPVAPATPSSSASSNPNVTKMSINPSTTTSSTASHQHQQEQELLSNFAVPNPPVSTQQSSVAAEKENPSGLGSGDAPRTLWMGDLDPWLDENAIGDLWWQILQKKVTVKIIQPRATRPDATYQGLSHSGYCFVEFESFDDAQQALGLNGQLLPDIAMPSQQQFPNNPDNQKKYFRLNWASGATLSAPIIQTPEFSLFVGDLSASTTEAHLLAFFQKNFPTSIKTVRVMTDPVSGKSRCFGFVRFTDESERQRALIEMNGVWFGGRPLRVALATPRNNSRNKFQQNSNDNYFNQGDSNSQQDLMYLHHHHPPPQQHPPPQHLHNSYGNYGNQLPYLQGNPYDEHRNQEVPPSNSPLPSNSQGQQFTDPNNTTVFVGGLSAEVTEPTLFTLFKPFGVIQQVKIPPGKNCGFIKYSTREEAEESIAAMQGFIIGGNRVRLSWGRVSVNNKKYQHQQQQVAQVAQIQAAAALSLGMDPAVAAATAAAAAAGIAGGPGNYPSNIPGSHQIPPPLIPGGPSYPITQPHHYQEPEYDHGGRGSDRSSSFDNSGPPEGSQNNPNNPGPQYYLPLPPHPGQEYNLPPGALAGQQEELLNAMNSLNLAGGEHGEINPESYMNAGYMVPPPMYNGGYPIPDMQYQQFLSHQQRQHHHNSHHHHHSQHQEEFQEDSEKPEPTEIEN